MDITQKITLDLDRRSVYTAICAKQGDEKSRKVQITLVSGGAVYKAPSGAQAKFRAQKPDGTMVLNPAVVNSDGTVTVELTRQTIAVPGEVTADVYLTDSTGSVLSSASFVIHVEPAPSGMQTDSENEYLVLVEMVDRAEKAAAGAEKSEKAATNAAQSADTSKKTAEASAMAAETAKSAAELSAQNAQRAAQTAAQDASAAAESARTASESESHAGMAEQRAADWAQDAESASTAAESARTAAEAAAKRAENAAGNAEHPNRTDNPHHVTAQQIGAAPAGYGLGEKSARVDSWDNATKNGFYHSSGGSFTGDAHGIVVSYPYRAGVCDQLAWSTWNNTHEMATRRVHDGVPGEWEYINPPMEAGVVYRTTRRYMGKPVYTKLIDCGTLPHNSRKNVSYGNTDPGGVGTGAPIAVIEVVASTNDGASFPRFVGAGNTPSFTVSTYSGEMQIITTGMSGASSSKVYAQIWYTRQSM